MKITFLSDNSTENPKCLAEWGLSVYIETGEKKVLFDLGASSMFVRNAKKLRIDLSEADLAVISHGHYDHTGGMEAFAEINGKAPVYIHRSALQEFYGTDDNGNMDDYNCGILWSQELKDRLADRLVFTDHVTEIDENIALIGDIKPLDEFPMTENFYIPVDADKKEFRPDPMDHEQVLVIKETGALHVFSGCAHTGIMAILHRVREEYPGMPIRSVTAGMHLYSLPEHKKREVVEAMAEMKIGYVLPVHCTGMEAIMMFREKMGEGCIIAKAGETYEF